jgi:hypothetical protein
MRGRQIAVRSSPSSSRARWIRSCPAGPPASGTTSHSPCNPAEGRSGCGHRWLPVEGARPIRSAIARTPSPSRCGVAIRWRSSSDRYRPDRTSSARRSGGSPPFSARQRYPVLRPMPTTCTPRPSPSRTRSAASTATPHPAAASGLSSPSTRPSTITSVLRGAAEPKRRQRVKIRASLTNEALTFAGRNGSSSRLTMAGHEAPRSGSAVIGCCRTVYTRRKSSTASYPLRVRVLTWLTRTLRILRRRLPILPRYLERDCLLPDRGGCLCARP